MAARWGTPCGTCGLDQAMCLGHQPPRRARRCPVIVVNVATGQVDACDEVADHNVDLRGRRYVVAEGGGLACLQHAMLIADLLNGRPASTRRAA